MTYLCIGLTNSVVKASDRWKADHCRHCSPMLASETPCKFYLSVDLCVTQVMYLIPFASWTAHLAWNWFTYAFRVSFLTPNSCLLFELLIIIVSTYFLLTWRWKLCSTISNVRQVRCDCLSFRSEKFWQCNVVQNLNNFPSNLYMDIYGMILLNG